MRCDLKRGDNERFKTSDILDSVLQYWVFKESHWASGKKGQQDKDSNREQLEMFSDTVIVSDHIRIKA